ncbi:MAG: NusG domain II-containing protein [Treponema sp.]|nr:NusG domain II-containing protein [Treponema sp.]
MKRKLPIKLFDPVIFILALAITLFSAYQVYFRQGDTIRVRIEGQGRRWVYPLHAEETIAVPGPLGSTIVRISGNHAWVESSPCANQICVAAGQLHRHADFAACLPNEVLVLIEGITAPGDVDATTR